MRAATHSNVVGRMPTSTAVRRMPAATTIGVARARLQHYRKILGYRREYKPAEAAKSALSAQVLFELTNLAKAGNKLC